MKKSSLLSCTVLSCMLFTGLGVASAAAETKSDLPKPVVVVAPDDVPVAQSVVLPITIKSPAI